jgi:aminoglycoside/choline kinase family phosphotransferase
MKRFGMKIEVSRFKDGRLKVIVHHEEKSYFWKSSLTECPRFENEKMKLEALMMVDWWNKRHRREFELLWNSFSVSK